MILSSDFAVLQTPVLDGLSFGPFPFQQDVLAAPKANVGSPSDHERLCVTRGHAVDRDFFGLRIVQGLFSNS